MRSHKRQLPSLIILLILMIIISSCDQVAEIGQADIDGADIITPEEEDTATLANTETMQNTATSTETYPPTITPTNTTTLTPRMTLAPSITSSPTFDFPGVEVNVAAAHCRYGPSKSFMHAADLYEGDHGEVRGRFQYSDWLYVKFDKLNYYCWVSPYVVDITGELSNVMFQDLNLQLVGSFDLYEPASILRTSRKGDEVTIVWEQVPMTEDDDRGYLIIAWVCQDGSYLWWTQSFENQYTTSYTVVDDGTCGGLQSSGVLYTVEKHGFSEPVIIPWPAYQK